MSLKERILLRMFERPEGVLGRLGGISLARANRKFAQEVVSLLHVQPFDHVLEVGSGLGIELPARAARKGEVAGIAPSEVMVRQATGRNAAAIRSGLVDLRLGTVESMPFEDDAFDTVLAINPMQVWRDVDCWRRDSVRPAFGCPDLGVKASASLPPGFSTRRISRRFIPEIEANDYSTALRPILRNLQCRLFRR